MKRHAPDALKCLTAAGMRVATYSPATEACAMDCSCGYRGGMFSSQIGAALAWVAHVEREAMIEAARMAGLTFDELAAAQ